MSEDRWERRLNREKKARKEAEKLLEDKSLELWELNQSLEAQVAKRTEELEQALETVEKASRAKDDFLSSMSHEIRTPLNAIIGFVDIMLKQEPDAEKRTRYLKIIQQSGKSLLRIINDILDFTKLQSGKFNIHRTNTDLRAILSDNCKLFAAEAKVKGINYSYSFNHGFPSTLHADEIRIVQILNNFTSNAIKFTPQNGSVDVTINYDLEQKSFILKVKDTGIGIAKEKHESIFVPFEQEESGTTREYGGTGLGLAICVSLIKLMNGKLIFESEKNKGSTFGFQIPIQDS